MTSNIYLNYIFLQIEEMEALITLGETTRNRFTFGNPVLYDKCGRSYQFVETRYSDLLGSDSSFEQNTMRAFDFKLIKGSGKYWQEAPRIGTTLSFIDPSGNSSVVCTGRVSYVHLGRHRSYGLIYLDEFEWLSEEPDFTS